MMAWQAPLWRQCPAFRSRMSLRRRTPCCVSGPRRPASHCRHTCVAGSSRRRAPRRSRRSWIVLEGGQVARFHSRRRLRRCERTVLVVDASVLAPALADDGPDGDAARARLCGQSLVAPELIDLETTSVIGRQLLAGHLDAKSQTRPHRSRRTDPAPSSPPAAADSLLRAQRKRHRVRCGLHRPR